MTNARTIPLPARLWRHLQSLADVDGVSLGKTDAVIFALLMMFLLCSAFSIALTQIGYFGALIVWVGSMVYRRKNEFPRTSLDLFMIGYAIAEVLSTIFSLNKPQALLYTQRRLLLLPIIYVLVANARTTKQLKALVSALLISALFVSLWSFRDLIANFGEYLLFHRRLISFQIPMTAGGIMMIAILMLLPFTLHPGTPRKLRLWGLVALTPLLVNLLFTFTRSSWLGFMAGAILIGVIRSKKVFLPLIITVVVIVLVSTPAMQDRMFSIFDLHHPTNQTRLNMWQVGVKIFHDYPILGIGDIGVEILWTQYSPPGWEWEGHLHNNLLMWLVTLGVVGFGALVALFVKIWIEVRRTQKRLYENWFLGSLTLGALAVLLGFHVNGLFEWNFGDAEIIMLTWAVVGLTFAADKIAQREGTT